MVGEGDIWRQTKEWIECEKLKEECRQMNRLTIIGDRFRKTKKDKRKMEM